MDDIQENKVGQKVKEYFARIGLTQKEVAKKLGISQAAVNALLNGKPFGKKTAQKWSELFGFKPNWLITGEGNMMLEQSPYLVKEPEMKIYRDIPKGVPYYDVDFVGGFDLIYNDQTVQPSYYIDFEKYNMADCWANMTGRSMEPELSPGDIIALKEIFEWDKFLLMDEIYGIITINNLRTIKRVSQGGDREHYKLIPLNTHEFSAQEIPINVIQRVFKVLGCVKRIG